MKSNREILNEVLEKTYPLYIDRKYIMSAELTDIYGKTYKLNNSKSLEKLADKQFCSRVEKMSFSVDVPKLMRDFVQEYVEFEETQND